MICAMVCSIGVFEAQFPWPNDRRFSGGFELSTIKWPAATRSPAIFTKPMALVRVNHKSSRASMVTSLKQDVGSSKLCMPKVRHLLHS